MKSACDKLKIAEYLKGRVTGAELLELEEHLKECQECASFLKLQQVLSGWEEKTEFSKEFDSKVLNSACELVTSRKKTGLFFAYTWKTAAAFVLFFVLLAGYKNTVYDETLSKLKAISRADLSTKIEIKDLKLYVTSRLCRELAAGTTDKHNILNYELMLSVPENIMAAEQNNDIKELLAENIKIKSNDRNALLLALDNTVNLLEEGLKINLSFASTTTREGTGLKAYKNATLAFESGNYEAALEGYKSTYAAADDELLACSSMFRMGFIKDCLGRHGEAVNDYKTVREKFPLKVQAIMSEELGRFAAKKKAFMAELERLKGVEDEKNPSLACFKIAGIYMQLMDYKAAAGYYARGIESSKDPASKQSLFNAGWCYKNQGEYRKAAKYFAALSLDVKFNQLADYELALSYLKMGDTAGAARLMDVEKDSRGEGPEIYKNLIKKYFKAVEKGR